MRAGLFAASALLGAVVGAVLITFAVGAPEAPPTTHPQIVSSSTSLQSFLWVYDDIGRTITFCFSAASPPTGPQYDFSCKNHPMTDTYMSN
jgi:hypothetical protein